MLSSAHRRHVALTAVLGLAASLGSAQAPGAAAGPPAVVGCGTATVDWSALQRQVAATQRLALRRLQAADASPYASWPVVARDGASTWRSSPDPRAWTSGFFPGELWLAYELTGDPRWAARAARRTAGLALAADSTRHDLGFIVFDSFGQGERLTGRRDYMPVIDRAAASLARHYDPAVGAAWSWHDGETAAQPFDVIVDSVMNLDLLSWAQTHGGPAHGQAIAHQHALTVVRTLLRPNGSTFHVADFDTVTGRLTRQHTVQGWSDASTWSRGQAWAVYGLTQAYERSRDRTLLRAAQRAAEYWVAHLPADCVPPADFDQPPALPQKDSSAAAVAASGLLELARVEPSPVRAATYRASALRTLRSLTSPAYTTAGRRSPAVLRRALTRATGLTAATPQESLPYADYYLLEAMLRLRLQPDPSARPLRTVTTRPTRGAAQAALPRTRRVDGVRVRWQDGASAAHRFTVQVSSDGSRWRTVLASMSSGLTDGVEEYRLPAIYARFVRVSALSAPPGAPPAVRTLVVVHGH